MRFLLLISVALSTSLFSCQQKQNLLIPDFFSEFLESIKEDVNEMDEERGAPSVIVNKDQAAAMGISTSQIASEIQKLMNGTKAYTLEEMLELDFSVRNFKGKLIQVPFSTVIRIEYDVQK